MSIFGAMQSGISGLAAQSSAMGAISDNIANVNTIGYKVTGNKFSTLVTKQTSSTLYSPGGVQSRPRQEISAQGLLSSTSSSTDLGISGSGFFVVNQAANPGEGICGLIPVPAALGWMITAIWLIPAVSMLRVGLCCLGTAIRMPAWLMLTALTI